MTSPSSVGRVPPVAYPIPPLPPRNTFFLGGPTASGKSALALDLAEATGAEVVGADAFQIYAGLPILSAQPSPADQERVPHHLVGAVDAADRMDAAKYQTLALAEIAGIHARGKPAIVVGGTGLYIKTLTHGLSTLPAPDPILRAELEALDPLTCRSRLEALDPIGARSIDLANPRRVSRALEIVVQTGKPLAEARTTWRAGAVEGVPGTPDDRDAPEGSLAPCGVFVDPDRESLKRQIARRTEAMYASGVVEEVRRQLAGGRLGPTASQMLGLREIGRVCTGEWSEEQAAEAIIRATTRYAKRQRTWFKAQKCLVPLPQPTHGERMEHALALFEQTVR